MKRYHNPVKFFTPASESRRVGHPLLSWCVVLVITLVLLPAWSAQAAPSQESAATGAVDIVSHLPLSFVPNNGQLDPSVSFYVTGTSGTTFFQRGGVSFALAGGAATHMHFVRANPAPAIAGTVPLPGRFNHMVGSDPVQWRTSLPTYAGIAYQQLYDGIDLRYEGSGTTLKSTYTVAPGSVPDQIRWRYENAEQIEVDAATGNLLITTVVDVPHTTQPSTLTEEAPVAWQTINGQHVEVAVRYKLSGDESNPTVGFQLGSYDPAYPLTIDPTLDFSTYLGAGNTTRANSIAVDSDGNVYIAGETNAPSFPTSVNTFQSEYGGAGSEAFVVKLDANGDALIYSTLLGGEGWDYGFGIAVDSTGNAYVTGETDSTDFPTRHELRHEPTGECYRGDLTERRCPDAFIAMLNPDGDELIYSTLLGTDHPDRANDIVVDNFGQAYIVGTTLIEGLENEDGEQSATDGTGDVFALKLSFEGRYQIYRTRFQGSGDDRGYGIALDSATGNVVITGRTDSPDFLASSVLQPGLADANANPNRNGDAFVIQLDPDGDTLYSTYLGGSSGDGGYDVAVDGEGTVYITGLTHSPDFPTVNAAQGTFGGGTCTDALETFNCQDGFVASLSTDDNSLRYSTYLGGSAGDEGWALTVDIAGYASVTGWSESADFPTVRPLDADWSVAGRDAFVTRLSPDGRLDADAPDTFSTLLGGNGDDYGRAITLDSAGNICVTGDTTSGDFPTHNAWKGRPDGAVDSFITRLFPAAEAGTTPSTTDPDTPIADIPSATAPPPPPYSGSFAAEAFRSVWERTDLPLVEALPTLQPRSWLWGPQPISGMAWEPYDQAAGGVRLVQYFDKSRMEINNPGAPRSQWQVSNGLLVMEMIEGRIQVGEGRYQDWVPSNEVVAGDPAASNPDAPTYRSFRSVAYPINPAPAPQRENTRVITVLNRDGTTHDNPFLVEYNIVLRGYDAQLGHNIPDVFLDFFDSEGLIYENGQYVQGQLMDWRSVLGLPISEPYWTQVRVGGETRDVLVQAFQRRMLTYTPDNPPELRVEMGNVGQHYLQWRYGR